MTKLLSSLVLFAILFVACGKVDSAEPTAPAGSPAGQAAPESAQATNAPTSEAQAAADPEAAAALAEFQKRITAYVKVHNDAEGKVPNLRETDDPQKISDREKALAQMIMTLRPGAVDGEIFAPQYQPYFTKLVRLDFANRSAIDRQALVQELPKHMKIDINTIYPTTIPLATFPPALLRKLPDLPPELEYRIVGRSLLLRDVKANLIVDILRDVVPTIPS